MTRLIFIAALAATLPLAPAPAEQVRTIGYADLDLSSSAGVAKLDRRIRTAAAALCGEASDADLEGKEAVKDCRAGVIAAVAATRGRAIRTAARTGGTQLAAGR